MSWKEEFWKSIKGFDTEEKLDLYFYRPFGFLIAKIGRVLGLTPTQLTLTGLVLGLSCGYFFYHNESTESLLLASVLLVMAGVFDSADGQLARMGGKSTKIGIVLDGLCDNLVFASAYIGCALTIPSFGVWLWPIAFTAGACHSFQSSMLDYYNREYLYFGYGKVNGDYWNPTLPEARTEKAAAATREERIFWGLRFSWLWQQNKLSSRSDGTRHHWSALQKKYGEEFQSLYRDRNRIILRAWRLMGPNFHTILILTCAFFRRFDIYLVSVDICFLTVMLFVLRGLQARQDTKLAEDLLKRGLT